MQGPLVLVLWLALRVSPKVSAFSSVPLIQFSDSPLLPPHTYFKV